MNITDNNNESIIVSIKCTAYNHEKYIRETLEGFIMQKTNFRFEAIVHDDASTDNTADIIREYAEKYPDIIKPIYETENQYSKKDGSLLRIMNKASKGKYIALCEGDDYWTDPYKLQKQVDFLEGHPDYVMCSHRYKVYHQNNSSFEDKIIPNISCNGPRTYTLNDLIKGKWLAHTLTVLYRRDAFDLNYYMKYKIRLDVVLYYLLLKKGKGVLLDDVMAVYRVHSGGVWSRLQEQERYMSELKQRLAIYEVEKNKDAADFIFNTILSRPLSRKIMLMNISTVWNILKIIYKEKGFNNFIKLVFKRFVY